MNYILKDKLAVPEPDFIEWAKAFEIGNRKVARDKIGDIDISTVFLGIDHGPSESGQPLLFETMIFGGKHDQYQARCSRGVFNGTRIIQNVAVGQQIQASWISD